MNDLHANSKTLLVNIDRIQARLEALAAFGKMPMVVLIATLEVRQICLPENI